MDRKLTIYFTSDIHGYFAPTDYAKNCRADTGLANCAANFSDDGRTLILDGGDTLQGSPFTYWLYSRTEEKSLVPARLMNLAGYHFVTLGNHDFNYGVEELQRYIDALDAKCLCANVEGLDNVGKTALVTLKNGLRVGITAITSLIKGHGSLSLGNIIGANLFNIVLVSGASIAISPFAIPAEKTVLGGINSSLVIDLPLMLGVMAIMCLPALIKGKLQRWQGILLLCIYASFTVYQFVA